MCGIAGLFLKDRTLQPQLGTLLAGMLAPLNDRGPDSAGFAVYGSEVPGCVKLTIRVPPRFDLDQLLNSLRDVVAAPVVHQMHGSHVVLVLPAARERPARQAIGSFNDITVVGSGRRMELFKEVGRPDHVACEFGLASMSGTHAIAHTRMATESAVTTDGAHPFTTGPDQCLVHNGSLSNHNALRRALRRQGLSFQTDNDTEVAAGFMTWRMGVGDSLEQALSASLVALDGFYTFVVGTETGFGVLRDPIACKPAVMAENDRWVAFGTEYRALVDLPGIGSATVWEPVPAKPYLWELH